MLWALVVPCCAWALVRGFGLERGYPLVPLIAFTPYAAAVTAAVALLSVAARQRAAAVVAAGAAATLMAGIAPRALGDGGGPAEGRSLRVMSVNLHRGHASAEQVVALARRWRADVLSLQEVDAAGIARLERAGLREVLPHRALALGRGTHGTALFARRPLRREPTRGTWNAQAVAVSDGVELTAVHPPAPATATRVRAWGRDLRGLPPAGRRARILAGDFNATVDHASLRRLLATGYRDAAGAVGAGLRGTWPVGGSLPPVAIDHVLVDERIGVRAVALQEIDGSDHRALLAHLVLPDRR